VGGGGGGGGETCRRKEICVVAAAVGGDGEVERGGLHHSRAEQNDSLAILHRVGDFSWKAG
jgi:hypothetical protein